VPEPLAVGAPTHNSNCLRRRAIDTFASNTESSRTRSSSPPRFDEVGRQAIQADPDWMDGDYYGKTTPRRGLALAISLRLPRPTPRNT